MKRKLYPTIAIARFMRVELVEQDGDGRVAFRMKNQ